MHKFLRTLPAFLLLGWAVSTDLSAANWPRFRGPNGTGVAADKDVPIEFSDTKNVLWKTPIIGVGHSSPIVWGDRLFLETAPDVTQRQLVCVDTTNGKILWSKSIAGGAAHVHKKSSHASSTPATDGERVYAAFWDGQHIFLTAFDFAGKQLWRRDLGSFTSQHGAGASPVVWQDKVFFNFDQDRGQDQGQDNPTAIMAFDAKTGKPLWEKKREGFRTCYSTPFVIEKPGVPAELIVGSTAGVTSYNPQTGAENWNWAWKHIGMPLRTVGSPIAGDGLIFAAGGDGNGSRHTVALKPGPKAAVVWEKNKGKFLPYVPTMLVQGEHLYFVSDSGVATCYVAKTGEEVWSRNLSDSFTSSPVLIDGKVYAANELGDVYVFPAEPTFKQLARNKLGEKIVASPAVANNRLYIRGENNLFCIGKKAQ
jgi:outer membrane protein assembly factor BamB